jgi:hypothetical protein
LQKRGKDVAALVSLEDLAMLEELEDRLDVLDALRAEAEAAAKGEKPIAWEKSEKRIGAVGLSELIAGADLGRCPRLG